MVLAAERRERGRHVSLCDDAAAGGADGYLRATEEAQGGAVESSSVELLTVGILLVVFEGVFFKIIFWVSSSWFWGWGQFEKQLGEDFRDERSFSSIYQVHWLGLVMGPRRLLLGWPRIFWGPGVQAEKRLCPQHAALPRLANLLISMWTSGGRWMSLCLVAREELAAAGVNGWE